MLDTRTWAPTIRPPQSTDATDASAGWYWQFNQKQGFKHDGNNPNSLINTWITSINENSGWLSVNDPCSISLGKGWRLPTQTEWENVDLNEGGTIYLTHIPPFSNYMLQVIWTLMMDYF
jgi:hypothetical protein